MQGTEEGPGACLGHPHHQLQSLPSVRGARKGSSGHGTGSGQVLPAAPAPTLTPCPGTSRTQQIPGRIAQWDYDQLPDR